MLPARRLAFAALLSALVLAAQAPAEDSPLAQVPDHAPVVIHVRGYGRVKDRIVTMAKNAAPDMAAMIQLGVEAGIAKALNGRELKGLAPDGSIFLVLLELPEPGKDQDLHEPMAAVIARITNYADFRDGILHEDERKTLKKEDGYEVATTENDKQVYFVDRKDYVIVSPRKDVAQRLSKKQGQGLAATIHPNEARRLLEPDVAVYVDMAAINKTYGPAIQQGRQQIEKLLEEGNPFFNKGNESYAEMFKLVFGGFFQAVEDGQSATLSLDFRPQGLALHARARFRADTATGKTLKTFQTSDLKEIGTLPEGSMIYSAVKVDPAMMKGMKSMLYGVMTKGLDAEAQKKVRQAFKELTDAGPRTDMGAINLPTQGIQVWDYEDPAKAVEAERKLFETLKAGGSFQFTVLKGKPELKADERTYRDFKLSHLKLEWDLDKMVEGIPGGGQAAIDSMKKLMGEGLNVWFGTNGKTYVQVSGKDWKQAKHYLDAYLDGKATLGQEQAFRDSRKHLPAQTTMLVLMDMPVYVRMVAGYAMAILGRGTGEDATKAPAKGTPSYLGVAITLRPEVGSFDLWLPGSSVAEIRKAFESFRGGGQ